jgi:hypothetical protein
MKPHQISALLLSFLFVMCINAFGADSSVLFAQNDQRTDSLRLRMEDRKDDSSSGGAIPFWRFAQVDN